MRENIKKLIHWWKFTQPHKLRFFFQFFTALLHRICLIVGPIFAAKVISSVAIGNFNTAMIYLTVTFGFLLLRNIIIDINYRIYTSSISIPYMRLQRQIADKLFNAKDINFKKNPPSKLLNIFHNDCEILSDFQDTLATRIADLFQVILTIGAVLLFNIYIAIMILLVNILNFFILNKLQDNLAKDEESLKETNDRQFEAFSELFEAKDKTSFADTKTLVEKKFLENAKQYRRALHKKTVHQSHVENWFFVFYQAIIFAATLLLITFVSKGMLRFELYLIIVPYLVSGFEVTTEFFKIFNDIKVTHISVMRVKNILQFSERAVLESGNTEADFGYSSIDFTNVSFTHEDAESEIPTVRNLNFHIKSNETTLIYGEKGSGKRTLFHLLTREIKAQNGRVSINSLDVWDYSLASYMKNLNVVTDKPLFLNASIMKNFKMVEKDVNVIYRACKEVGVHEKIMQLPNEYSTEMESVPNDVKHLLEFARLILIRCQIILLYEVMNEMSETEKEFMIRAIKHLQKTKTLIIFSSQPDYADLCNKIIEIKNGEIVNIQFNQNVQE